MGIAGLLPNLKSVTERLPIASLRGKTVAVDAYCLLHKGAYSCSRELVEGIPTDKCTNYCVRRIDMLVEAGIIPYVVFDGGPLPNKREEEDARRALRAESLQKARHLWQQGSKVASMEYYQRAVDITPEIANGLAQALKQRSIKFVIAPYEADAQCAYLAINGFVDAVLTEDSDLLCYGCPSVLFKFDGNLADRVQFGDLAHCRELSFVGWDLYMFQQMCVLAGCDFVKALPGIGMKKAHGHMRRTRSVERVIRGLRFDGIKVPKEYAAKVQRALWTFKYQRVYCPRRRCVVNLHDIPELGLESDGFCPEAAALVGGEADFLGKEIPSVTARGIAEGRLNPVTWMPFSSGGRDAGVERHHSLLMRQVRMAHRQGRFGGQAEPKNDSKDIPRQLSHQSWAGSESSRPGAHVRKPNGQLMVNLQAIKKGLKRALGETDADINAENNDMNSKMVARRLIGQPLQAQEPLWVPGVAAAMATSNEDVSGDPTRQSHSIRSGIIQKKARQGLTPNRSEQDNSMLYDNGFESPAVTASDGCLFSSRKYREQMDRGSGLHYASVERDASESADRIEAFWATRGRQEETIKPNANHANDS